MLSPTKAACFSVSGKVRRLEIETIKMETKIAKLNRRFRSKI
ncbi:thap domain-containing protein 2 [Roseibium sp. TrichSKD4]|nr:thap domain-containing protein 2 [Roseibium sp. TrichSKD4]